MAKKKAVKKAPEATTDGKIPPGWKRCPSCNELVKGARTKQCPKCAAPFPVKEAAKTKTRQPRQTREAHAPVNTQDRLSQISEAVKLVEKLGGIEEAKKKIAVVKELLG